MKYSGVRVCGTCYHSKNNKMFLVKLQVVSFVIIPRDNPGPVFP